MSTSVPGEPEARYLADVVHDAEVLADEVSAALGDGCFPLVLGGDHSVAVGTMGGLARSEPNHGLIWVDAHADFNTPETTPSGNVHGMPVAAILGDGDRRLVEAAGVSPKALASNTALVGLRDVDPGEAERLRNSDVSYFTMRDIDERGVVGIVAEVIAVATADDVDRVHLSFDLDAVDPRHAPGTGTPVVGGLTYREAHLMMELLAEADVVTSAEFVEVNPALDLRNQTAQMTVALIASLCGERIL